MNLIDKVRPVAKAVVGFFAPALTAALVALTPGSPGGSTITGDEWTTSILAAVVTSLIVWAVPNRNPSNSAPASGSIDRNAP